uniref:Uncharacterized protein n=2 Tax=Phaeomonas parva TaxID=124430 RepID=A0A7S1XWK2_9STRA|mmetsp:Transcript_39221/g.122714  ORF Transcript_39221/g.122714 Transcript_39221/m.122714 type:complete len:154 (+) Transcript_39221:85-546(+)
MAALNMLRLALMPATDIEDLEAGHRAYLENSKDWLEGPQLCSYKGSVHLAWSFPLPQATYLMGGMGLHAFLMFVPALCIGGLTELDSFSFLLLTGPVMAMIVAPNTLEQPSTWCFISIGQVCIGAMSSMMQLKTRPALAATRAEDLKEPLIEG